jgi:intracellular septation protein A
MKQNKFQSILAFVINNFGPLLVFYAVNHLYGLKIAIASTVLFTIIEIVYRWRRKEKTTAIFKYSAFMSLVFGAVDLYADQSFLFKYEACVTNLLTAGVFVSSLWSERSIIHDFYEKQTDAKPVSSAMMIYFRWVTLVWVAYFVLKAGAYFWIADHYSLEQGLLIRVILGTASFYALLAISILGGRPIFKALQSKGLLPQDEKAQNTEIV